MSFGFVQLSLDTRTEGWDACSGYNYYDNHILGFSHTHLSGTGAHDFWELLLLPFSREPVAADSDRTFATTRFAAEFSHAEEEAHPGYYRVQLQPDGMDVELTATAHCGIHRSGFALGVSEHVLIDLVHNLNNRPADAASTLEEDRELAGWRSNNGRRNRTGSTD